MKFLRERFALTVLIMAFGWASVSIALRRSKDAPRGTSVIRIGHWQLEAGVREGFDRLAEEFSKLPQVKAKYGQVRIVQDAIPEGIYGQWISTQMIGGTAPDVVEVGNGLPWPIWIAYQNRYFEPLSDLAAQANPFNQGTVLEGKPLKNTFGDGMRSGYQEELQQYMRVPLARFTSRVFYNRDLLKRLTGFDRPPTDFRTFIDACRRIGATHDEKGEFYTPIAASKYHAGAWQTCLFDPLTYSLLFKADFNRDGWVGNDETFVGLKTGAISFETPAIKSKFQITRQVQQQFQPGFTGLTRDEAVFLFAQQRAVFISTGTWDAGGLIEQAKGKFTVGVMAFPQPAKTDPEYGSLIVGPNFDKVEQGFAFGVTRFSKNPALAKDFLLYLASCDGNRMLNEIIGWIPSVTATPMPPLLKDFKPVDQGMYACFNLDIGGETVVKYQQLYSRYQNDRAYNYDHFAGEFGSFYLHRGQSDFEEQQRDWRRAILNGERFLASLRARAMQSSADQDSPEWIRYRLYTSARQFTPEIGHAIQQKLVKDGPSSAVGPYEYRPEALAFAREQLRRAATQPTTAAAAAAPATDPIGGGR